MEVRVRQSRATPSIDRYWGFDWPTNVDVVCILLPRYSAALSYIVCRVERCDADPIPSMDMLGLVGYHLWVGG